MQKTEDCAGSQVAAELSVSLSDQYEQLKGERFGNGRISNPTGKQPETEEQM